MARKTFGRDGATIVVNDGATVYAVRSDDEFDAGKVGVPTVSDASEVRTTQFEPIADGSDDSTTDSDTNETGQPSYVDPTTITTPGKKPRRKRGPNKPKPSAVTATPLITANLEKVLLNLHLMGSALLQEPELQLDQDEAKLLADAVTEVATAYNWSAVISPKTQACVDMGIALATVYTKRAITIYHKHTRKGGPVRVQPIATGTNAQ